jgi:hypothetical protein
MKQDANTCKREGVQHQLSAFLQINNNQSANIKIKKAPPAEGQFLR